VILVDTSVWIDHLRVGDPKLSALLQDAQVLAHPWVIGELALGQLSRRSEILRLLSNLPLATVATEAEVMTLVETQRLFGLGIGNVDAHLLAATLLTTDASLWTRDKRLAAASTDLGISYRASRSRADTPLRSM
jgi:predicted nucleic acid-binding protein